MLKHHDPLSHSATAQTWEQEQLVCPNSIIHQFMCPTWTQSCFSLAFGGNHWEFFFFRYLNSSHILKVVMCRRRKTPSHLPISHNQSPSHERCDSFSFCHPEKLGCWYSFILWLSTFHQQDESNINSCVIYLTLRHKPAGRRITKVSVWFFFKGMTIFGSSFRFTR